MPDEQLMKVMAGGPAGGAAPSPSAPVSAPMTTPQENQGDQAGAMVDISMALDLLEKSLMAFGSESEEGKAIHSALGTLIRKFGEKREKAKPLVPAEIMQLMSQLPQGGGATPEMKAMMGGGAPGGAPMPMAA